MKRSGAFTGTPLATLEPNADGTFPVFAPHECEVPLPVHMHAQAPRRVGPTQNGSKYVDILKAARSYEWTHDFVCRD